MLPPAPLFPALSWPALGRTTRRIVAVVVLAASLAAARVDPAGASRVGTQPRGAITVSAAASLTEAFTAVGTRFERRNPRTSIAFNFGSSSTLATQVLGGAPVDVYASADRATMARLVEEAAVTTPPTPFARNRMLIAVKPGNPRRVTDVADLARLSRRGVVALCGPAVPCGVYATEVLERAGVAIPESRVTRGADAKATLAAVARGDADAAIVYETDVTAAGAAVDAVAIPATENVSAVYPIAPIAASANPRLAAAFVGYVASPAGRRILARFGFRGP